MNPFPCLVRSSSPGGEARFALGEPLVDAYLEFVAGRARPNTLRAVAHDLKTFFAVIDKAPVAVVTADVFDFLADQRGDRTVIRLADRESGLSARTIARRLSSVSGLYAYLIARGDTGVRTNPVPRGLSTRRRGGRTHPRSPVVRRRSTGCLVVVCDHRAVDDIVAVEVITRSGGPHFVMTFGRVQDLTDPAALEELVLAHAGTFGLADAIRTRVCRSLQEASAAPYFYEAIIHFSGAMAEARAVDDFTAWQNTTDAAMRQGRDLYYLGDPSRSGQPSGGG